jgi:hypothetical protein
MLRGTVWTWLAFQVYNGQPHVLSFVKILAYAYLNIFFIQMVIQMKIVVNRSLQKHQKS